MALLFLDGMEGYGSSTDLFRNGSGPCRWSTTVGAPTITINSTTFRTTQVTGANSRALQSYWPGSGGQHGIYMNIPSSTELIVGFGFYYTNATGTATILSFWDTSSVSQGVCLGINLGTGTLTVSTVQNSGTPNTTLATSSTGLSPNAWNYIELRIKLGTTNGEAQIYLNGVQTLNVNNINTANGITSYSKLAFGIFHGSYTFAVVSFYFDDLYICDTTGATNNTFLGPISVYSLVPTGAGSSTQMSVTGAATNWQAVAEAGAADTGTYVSSATTGNKDYYTFETLPGSVTSVPGVLIRTVCTTPDAGTRKLKINLKYTASVISSALRGLSLGSWFTEYFVSDTAPDGAAWTKAKVDSLEGGGEAD